MRVIRSSRASVSRAPGRARDSTRPGAGTARSIVEAIVEKYRVGGGAGTGRCEEREKGDERRRAEDERSCVLSRSLSRLSLFAATRSAAYLLLMHISFALFADAANISQEGKLNIMGVFDAVQVGALPTMHPRATLVVRLKATR